MYAELILAEARLAELRRERVARRVTHGLPDAEIPRVNVRVRHEVFRRIIQR